MDRNQNDDIDSTTHNYNRTTFDETRINADDAKEIRITRDGPDEIPVITTTNPNSSSVSSTTTNPVIDSVTNKAKAELKQGQQQAEHVITKTKRIFKQHCKFKNCRNFVNMFKCPWPTSSI